ncbi:hypothetical protein [Fischerella thermalis]|uniref:hypothetical protein n=1 Tax=Fischerella thermalis TaxID=372787 RepID=UPI000C80E026|nr:hypothetical protein [Fischerella thermalis]PLZ90569.1 hypothetical protein CI593_08915 [Fischerella thermalis CCMEE 5194]
MSSDIYAIAHIGDFKLFVGEASKLSQKWPLISCTWKYECQIHNYVQEESSVEGKVKKKTQEFWER